jgi:hypothetical protein
MSKIFPILGILFILSIASLPLFAFGADAPTNTGLVQCDGVTVKCDAKQLNSLFSRILRFIVLDIATPLAVIAMIVGGLMMVMSPGNPSLATKGRQILITAVIGLLLAWCTDIIINTILTAIGATGKNISI